MDQPVEGPASEQTVRSFWHGRPLDAYQILAVRSFIDRGHVFELFSYDGDFVVPAGVRLRDANEIWPTDRVLTYQAGFGAGSPSLHSNLFRYAMLCRLGGWWADMDTILLQQELPQQSIYFARESLGTIVPGTIKFPAGHGLLAECVEKAAARGETVLWGENGPKLFDAMIKKHELEALALPYRTTYPIPWRQIGRLFDPAGTSEVAASCEGAAFLHLYHQIWRRSEIPTDLLPPEGSYMDMLLTRHRVEMATDRRMDFGDLETRLSWIATH